MKLTPINSAEAIFEAFFDETLSGLPLWKVAENGAAGLVVAQRWAWVQYDWTQAPAGDATPALRLRREFDLECADYDTLMVSLMAPPGARVALIAETDVGERRTVSTPFAHQKREVMLPLGGAKRLLGLAIEIYSNASPACGWFNWIGLQHGEALQRYLRQFARFDERWEDYLQPESIEPRFEPAYGLHLTSAELAEARSRLERAGGPRTSAL